MRYHRPSLCVINSDPYDFRVQNRSVTLHLRNLNNRAGVGRNTIVADDVRNLKLFKLLALSKPDIKVACFFVCFLALRRVLNVKIEDDMNP